MNSNNNLKALASPRCTKDLILFDVGSDGEVFECAISLEAMEDLTMTRCSSPTTALAMFSKERPRIEQLALAKLQVRAAGIEGRLHLWASDMEDLAKTGPQASRSRPAAR